MIAIWNSYQGWIVGISTLVLALIGAALLHKLAYYIAGRLARRTPSMVDDSLVRRTCRATRVLALLLTFLVFVPGVPLPPDAVRTAERIAILAVTATMGWLLIACVASGSDYVRARFDISNPDNLRARQVWTQVQLLQRFAISIIVVLTLCIMLMSVPGVKQVGVSLFASAGVAGLVIGVAAQQVLKNLIAGIQLALTEPVRVQDVVIIEGEWGTIEEIRSTYIVVKIWDLRRLVVPLSYFIEKPFQNWTRRTANILGTVFWYVDYTVPVDRFREQLQAVVKANPLWDGNVCGLQVTDVKERTIELRGLVSAANAGHAFDLRCQVRERMIQWLQQDYPESLPRIRADLHGDERFEGRGSQVQQMSPRPS